MTMTGPEFDVWMLRRAREKPSNPIYAHLAGRARVESLEEKSENVGQSVPQEKTQARPISVPRVVVEELSAKDAHIFVKPDFKQESSDHDDGDIWDAEPMEDE